MLSPEKEKNNEVISFESLQAELELWESKINENKSLSPVEPLNWSAEKLQNSLIMRDKNGHSIFQLSIKDRKMSRVAALWDLRRMKSYLIMNQPIQGPFKSNVELMKKLLEDIKQSKIAYGKIAYSINNDGSYSLEDVLRVLHLMSEIPLKAKAACEEKSLMFFIESLQEIQQVLEYNHKHYTNSEEGAKEIFETANYEYARIYRENKDLLFKLLGYCHEVLTFAEKLMMKIVSQPKVEFLEAVEEDNQLYDDCEMNFENHTVDMFMKELLIWEKTKKTKRGPLNWPDKKLHRSLISLDENEDTTLQVCILQEKENLIDALWQLRREKKFRIFDFDCNNSKDAKNLSNYSKLLSKIIKSKREYGEIIRSCEWTQANVVKAVCLMTDVSIATRDIWNDNELFFFCRGLVEIIDRLMFDRNIDAKRKGKTSCNTGPFYGKLMVKNQSLLLKLFSYCQESLNLIETYLRAVFFFHQIRFGNDASIASKLWESSFNELLTMEGLSILEVAARRGNARMFSWILEACGVKISEDDGNSSILAAKILYQALSAKDNSAAIIDRLSKSISRSLWQGILLCELDNSGNTAIHYAVKNTNLPALLKLCEHGVSMHVLNKEQQTPKAVIKPESEDILKFFNDLENLFEAAKEGKFAIVNNLLQNPPEQEAAKLNVKFTDKLTVNQVLQKHLGSG